jgi:hypothetical protein
MEEPKHILDTLIEKVSNELGKDIKVYLAMDDEDRELLAIKRGDEEKGLDLAQIVNSYGFYRIYQSDSEDEALDKLAKNLTKSIHTMLEEAPTED